VIIAEFDIKRCILFKPQFRKFKILISNQICSFAVWIRHARIGLLARSIELPIPDTALLLGFATVVAILSVTLRLTKTLALWFTIPIPQKTCTIMILIT